MNKGNLQHQKQCLKNNRDNGTECCVCEKIPFYQKYLCPNCHKIFQKCKCELNYCPFCPKKFGFTQDWNIHLQKNHICCDRIFTNKHAWSNHKRMHKKALQSNRSVKG